jgi:hypothetical protein
VNELLRFPVRATAAVGSLFIGLLFPSSASALSDCWSAWLFDLSAVPSFSKNLMSVVPGLRRCPSNPSNLDAAPCLRAIHGWNDKTKKALEAK